MAKDDGRVNLEISNGRKWHKFMQISGKTKVCAWCSEKRKTAEEMDNHVKVHVMIEFADIVHRMR